MQIACAHEPTFRTYRPELVRNAEGRLVTVQLCETLEAGRWEPFYSQVSGPAPAAVTN